MNVLDASVASKGFLDESDSDQARRLMEQAILNQRPFFVPPLFKIELVRSAKKSDKRLVLALDFFEN